MERGTSARRVVEGRVWCVPGSNELNYQTDEVQVAMRKLTIKKLPPVLSFQLKVNLPHPFVVRWQLITLSALLTMPRRPRSKRLSSFPRTST